MSQFSDYLFSLDKYGISILHDTIAWINGPLAKDRRTVEDLVSLLKQYRTDYPALQKYDQTAAKAILEAIIEMLEDNASIAHLCNRLDEYNNRYFAAIMLGWFGSQAQAAIPKLVSIASGSSSAVDVAKISVTLIGHADQEIMKSLYISVSAEDDGEFRELTDLMIRAGYGGKPTFWNLIKVAATNKNHHIREAVADTIKKLDFASKQELAFVLDQLKNDSDASVKEAAME